MQLNHMNNKSQNIGNSIKIYFILKLAKLQVILVTKKDTLLLFSMYLL